MQCFVMGSDTMRSQPWYVSAPNTFGVQPGLQRAHYVDLSLSFLLKRRCFDPDDDMLRFRHISRSALKVGENDI